MKFALKLPLKPGDLGADGRRTPSRVFGGRLRTSTLVLSLAFVALSWIYLTYRTNDEPSEKTETTKTIWVQQPPVTSTVTVTPEFTPTPTPTTTTKPVTTAPPPPPTSTAPPPFTLPCLVPALCPQTTPPAAPASPTPQPGPGPVPTPAPPAS